MQKTEALDMRKVPEGYFRAQLESCYRMLPKLENEKDIHADLMKACALLQVQKCSNQIDPTRSEYNLKDGGSMFVSLFPDKRNEGTCRAYTVWSKRTTQANDYSQIRTELLTADVSVNPLVDKWLCIPKKKIPQFLQNLGYSYA